MRGEITEHTDCQPSPARHSCSNGSLSAAPATDSIISSLYTTTQCVVLWATTTAERDNIYLSPPASQKVSVAVQSR